MKGLNKILLSLPLILLVSFSSFGQQNTVTIDLNGIRSDKGLIRLAVYDHAVQFPHDPSRFYSFDKKLLKEGTLRITLMNIPTGTYAISVLDDEDSNDRMNFNLLRMPKEGYGFSNNIKPGLKSPPYEKCTFRVGKGHTHLDIEIQYFREKS